jgi:AraC family transcriptional regulator
VNLLRRTQINCTWRDPGTNLAFPRPQQPAQSSAKGLTTERNPLNLCTRLTFQSADQLPPERKNDWWWAIGRHNLVTHVRSAHINFGCNVGPLSIKTVAAGSEVYESEGIRRVLEPDRYLVLNEGQQYTSLIESDDVVEGFCIWFRPGFVEQAAAALSSPPEALLDDPHSRRTGGVGFVDRLYSHDDLVWPIVDRMRSAYRSGRSDSRWLDEHFHLLAEAMLLGRDRTQREIERVPAVRRSTRLETYRRLHRAKDYLESNLSSPVELNEVATVAWLSPHHFLRQFQLLFGETPRQYQTRRRMEKARDLLTRTDQPVTDICFSLGFESLGSFSWLFRRLNGMPPSQYRAASRCASPKNDLRPAPRKWQS